MIRQYHDPPAAIYTLMEIIRDIDRHLLANTAVSVRFEGPIKDMRDTLEKIEADLRKEFGL